MTLDADGNVVSVTVAAPRFTPRERALLLASRRAEKVQRGRHGIPIAEATDPKNQFGFKVPPPSQDWAQKKLNEAHTAYAKEHPGVDMGSLLWRVERA
ncbi:hypothetical protein [Microbacterium sp.]|uniref:hypothetical protein n=1 Tax=Microbacterium sp. TaxID=51671 RepID=UPI003A9515F5